MRRGSAEPERPLAGVASGSVVRSALLRFTVFSLVTVLVLIIGSLFVAGRIARSLALDGARTQGAGIAARLAAPLVDADVRAGRPGAADQLTTVMANRMQDGSIAHVKLWDDSGRIIWSDQSELVGRSFELQDDVARLFGTRGTSAELSELTREENIQERTEGPLLEVYAGAFDDDGEPLVFEAYVATEQMDQNARTIFLSFLPLFVGSLGLFLLVVLPLARSLGRRVERAQADRATMMRHALLASDLERRRIAEDLHNGVVQELAGLGYTLPTATRQLVPGGDLTVARSALQRATDLVQRNVTALRKLMTDIYPPDLQGDGLRDAVQQLVRTEALSAGLVAEVRVEDGLSIAPDTGRLAYRVIREGVRNVVKHADASHVTVELGTHQGHVLVRVVDDGRGPGASPGTSPQGHLGLRLLTDTLHDFGGRLEVRAVDGGGTSLVARFPVTLVPG